MKVLIICGNHPRHYFILKPLFKEFKNIRCIMMEREPVEQAPNYKCNTMNEKILLKRHFKIRFDKESKFFGKKNIAENFSNKNMLYRSKSNLNSKKTLDFINHFKPNVCFVMGAGLLKNKLLNILPNLTINIHLGLSPWYRGSATLFWPSYNLEPWKTGVTFHKIDHNIDSGAILHQCRPRLEKNMGVIDLSIAAIKKAKVDFRKIIKKIKKKEKLSFKIQPTIGRTYFSNTFRAIHLKLIYEKFNDRIISYFFKNNTKLPKVNIIKMK